LHANRFEVYGVSNSKATAEEKAEAMRCFIRDVAPMLADGRIVPVVDKVFAFDDGSQPYGMEGTFKRLLAAAGLSLDKSSGQQRTLYSLRHTYAHFALLTDKMDVYTLARQMGTSVKMIEQHYGHLNPAMKADVIAGKRMGGKRTVAATKAETSTKLKVVK
jgi:integrase